MVAAPPEPAPLPAAAPHLADLSLTPPPASAAFNIVPSAEPGADSAPEGKRGSKAWIVVLLLAMVAGGGATYWFVLRPPPGKPTTGETGVQDAGVDAAGVADAGSKAAPPGKTDTPPTTKPGEPSELPMSVLDDLLKSGHSALEKCYAKAIKKNKGLVGGKLKATVEVAGKGKASEVLLTGTELDAKTGKCVQKALKKWKYPRQDDDYKTTFQLTIQPKSKGKDKDEDG